MHYKLLYIIILCNIVCVSCFSATKFVNIERTWSSEKQKCYKQILFGKDDVINVSPWMIDIEKTEKNCK